MVWTRTLHRLRNFRDYRLELGWRAAVTLSRRNVYGGPHLTLRVRGIRTPVHCRVDGSDFAVLRQVLGREEGLVPLSAPPRLIIDAGANVGYASLLYANHFPDAQILAIEPEAGNVEMFRLNTAAYPTIRIVPGALWHAQEPVTITNPDAPAWSFQVGQATASAPTQRSVPGYTLPQLLELAGAQRVDLLKVDIEGAELELLTRNADAWLGRVGVLLVELHDRFRPGCTAALDAALARYPHQRSRHGEYHVVRFT